MDTGHLRVLRLSDTLVGFYDGRVPGHRFAEEPNWVDDGALELGVCSYAIVDGGEALVYDTHISVAHAARIRATVEELGATRITVVLSHWHADHVAGTEAFADCEIVSNELTARQLADHRARMESGHPPIAPLVMPTTTFEGSAEIRVGSVMAELRQFDIHSRDETVIRLGDESVLLAGDTLEDTVTYVAEPDGLERHLDELDRLRRLGCERIYPAHGHPDVIADGGFGEGLISATELYVRELLRHERDPRPGDTHLKTFAAGSLEAGWIRYFEPYQRVHESNLEAVRGR